MRPVYVATAHLRGEVLSHAKTLDGTESSAPSSRTPNLLTRAETWRNPSHGESACCNGPDGGLVPSSVVKETEHVTKRLIDHRRLPARGKTHTIRLPKAHPPWTALRPQPSDATVFLSVMVRVRSHSLGIVGLRSRQDAPSQDLGKHIPRLAARVMAARVTNTERVAISFNAPVPPYEPTDSHC